MYDGALRFVCLAIPGFNGFHCLFTWWIVFHMWLGVECSLPLELGNTTFPWQCVLTRFPYLLFMISVSSLSSFVASSKSRETVALWNLYFWALWLASQWLEPWTLFIICLTLPSISLVLDGRNVYFTILTWSHKRA